MVESRKSTIVQFIHESVRDFLLGEQALATFESNLSSGIEAISQVYLARLCQQQVQAIALPANRRVVISPRRSDLQQLRRSYPLLDYAVDYLFEHTSDAQCLGKDQRELLWSLHSDRDELLTKWIYARGAQYRIKVQERYLYHHGQLSLLYIMIERGSPRFKVN